MQRRPLLRLLDHYATRFPGESECVVRFRRFVEQHENCFERTLEIGHVTGSAWLMNGPMDRVLLTHHAKLNRWFQLGGHADGNPNVLEVALCEAREESGLEDIEVLSGEIFDLDIHTIPARKGEPEHEHFDVRFAFVHRGRGDFVVGEESVDLSWVEVAKLGEVTGEESMLRMAAKWATGVRR